MGHDWIRQITKETPLYELVYYPALFIWIVLSVIGESRLNDSIPHHGPRILITIFIAIMYIAMRWDFSPKSFVFELGVLCVALTAFQYKYELIGMSVCLIYCARGLSMGKMMNTALVALGLSVSLVVVLSLLGFIPDVIYNRFTSEGVTIDRHCFGFGYTTFLSHYLLGITALLAYKRRLRFGPILSLALLAITTFVYVFTDSRTSFLLTLWIITVCVFTFFREKDPYRRGRRRNRPISDFFLRWSFPLLTCISILLLLCMPLKSPVGTVLDKLLSERIMLTQQAFDTYPTTAFGQNITWSTIRYVEGFGFLTGYNSTLTGEFVQAPYLYVDSSYMNLLLTQGVIPFTATIIALSVWSNWCLKNNKRALAFLLLVFAIKAVIDPQLLYLHYCPLLLGITCPLGCIGLRQVIDGQLTGATQRLSS